MNNSNTLTAKSNLRNLGYFLLSVITIIGIYALFIRFKDGLIVTNLTQNVPWGFWVAFYIYFIGLSAGSFLLSTLIFVFKLEQFEKAGKLALLQALICMGMGLWLIMLDLGHYERFYRIIINWNVSSILAWESMFYGLYLTVILAELYFAMRGDFFFRKTGKLMSPELVKKSHKWLLILGIIGLPIAIGVHGGTGALFAVAKARPGWFSGLFPIIFIISALASGAGLLTFIVSMTSKLPKPEKFKLVKSLATLTVGVIGFDMLLFISEILVTFYGNVPEEVRSWKLTMFGPWWWVFWFVQFGFAMLVPISIVAYKKTNQSVKWLGFAGFAAFVGIIGTRLNIVIPPMITPAFDTLPEAYHHFRFSYGYFPNFIEIFAALGSIAIGIWVMIFALKKLPIESAQDIEKNDNN